MQEQREFGYFVGEEASQYTFFQIPYLLFTNPRFKCLSNDAKLLYGLLLDRMGLSEYNGWHDKQGQGKPTKIYVKRFTTRSMPPEEQEPPAPSMPPVVGVEYSERRTTIFSTPGSRKSRGNDPEKPECNQTNPNQTDFIHTDPSIYPPAVPLDAMMDRYERREEVREQIGYATLKRNHPYDDVESLLELLVDVRAFAAWTENRPITQELAAAWKGHLLSTGHAPGTVNSMLAALNNLFRFLGWGIRVKFLKIQRRMFRDQSRELTREEYDLLLSTARAEGKERLALLMEAVCATGVRVSEVKYLTVEAAQVGRAEIALKGKIRAILLTNKLCRKLLKYTRKNKIASGEIFITRSGKGMSRRQIWAEMKGLCKAAGVAPEKVYPHNLRHLFARIFYKSCKDIARLADVLGHSSIETTRIYLLTTGAEHTRRLERLGLVS